MTILTGVYRSATDVTTGKSILMANTHNGSTHPMVQNRCKTAQFAELLHTNEHTRVSLHLVLPQMHKIMDI